MRSGEYHVAITHVHRVLVIRYKDMLPPESRTWKLCELFIREADNSPPDKQGRWVGFIQAEVISLGKTTIDIERDISRPMFQEVYKKSWGQVGSYGV